MAHVFSFTCLYWFYRNESQNLSKFYLMQKHDNKIRLNSVTVSMLSVAGGRAVINWLTDQSLRLEKSRLFVIQFCGGCVFLICNFLVSPQRAGFLEAALFTPE